VPSGGAAQGLNLNGPGKSGCGVRRNMHLSEEGGRAGR
jgi:hypothetical protein